MPKKTITLQVTPKMAGLITLIEQVQNGKLEGLVVVKGEPCSVTDTRQRIDFDRQEELAKVMAKRAVNVDMSSEETPVPTQKEP